MSNGGIKTADDAASAASAALRDSNKDLIARRFTTSGTGAGLQSTGHLNLGFSAKSSNFTADDEAAVYLCTTGAGGITATLPAAAGNGGRIYIFVKVDNGAGALTIDGAGAETINDAANYAGVTTQYDAVAIGCDGSEWFILSGYSI